MKKYFVLIAAALSLAACAGSDSTCADHEANAKAPILFRFDSVNFTPESQARVDDGLTYLTGHRFHDIELDGYADEVGGKTEYNMDLSRRRAEYVRDYMIKNGVAEKRITTRWHGVESGHPYKERRRVDVTVK